MEELVEVSARIYLAQGTADRALDAASCDVLAAQLEARGVRCVYDRVVGADHSFRNPDEPTRDGWSDVFDRILAWFEA